MLEKCNLRTFASDCERKPLQATGERRRRQELPLGLFSPLCCDCTSDVGPLVLSALRFS